MQCVEYASLRIKELSGFNSGITGNANTWYGNTTYCKKLSSPATWSIACWSGGSQGYGHVAVIEEWDEDEGIMNYSDANYYSDGKIVSRKGITETQMLKLFGSSFTFQGYVKLIK